ncbi:COR domain-containing protein [Mucilaginibacter flavidus]|uniref:COR domain-containing protein n=1 Tax=Mucilaginibacter flavidus TaxID=2949309 RepID=UPI002093914B|nr:COR domain-containing protein [Mucilaginibacter flavidus]MCO5947495.1 leucine-rich repeat domain-containing protein [Mucilaginibacter flavidus]
MFDDDPYHLIDICLKSKHISLALNGCKISDHDLIKGARLQTELSKCTHIKSLVLGSNKIKKLTGLDELKQLQKLALYQNEIETVDGLQNLVELRELDLSSNEITHLQGLENLTRLEKIDLGRNKIENASSLEKLTNLTKLYLNNNKISDLSFLAKLIKLESLDLNYNDLSIINPIQYLNELQHLDINYNKILDISALSKLPRLKKLNISNNKISDLSPLLNYLTSIHNSLKIVSKEPYSVRQGEINIQDNPLIIPPIEIIELGNESIANYFTEIEKQGVEYLYEAKMLIVGQPRAGKTSLRLKLFDSSAELPKEDKTTRGIDIERLEFDIIDKLGDSRKLFYNIWDFGGQQIYQTTHQFFLTHRSLYILVMDTGKDSIGNDDTAINYWLQCIELLGGNSPLLLIRNEKNERQITIDLPQKRARFSFLKNDYSVNLNALIPGTNTFKKARLNDFLALKEDIETELKRLPLVGYPMPKNWAQVRNELQKLSVNNHYISKNEFIALCKKNDVSDYDRQMELSRIFHDLGVFLHFQDYGMLEDFIILQNTWATDAVFAILDNSEVRKNKGRFNDGDLTGIWKHKDYEPSVHKKLLALMKQFELCYQIDKADTNTYIVPEMLSDSSPEGYKWVISNDLPIQYWYDFMPKGVLTRLIVRVHKHIAHFNKQQVVWKTGVKIDGASMDCPDTFAEITEAWDNKRLNILVQGLYAKELISKITFQIDELNNELFKQNRRDQLQKSRWYKMIPCCCASCKNAVFKHFYDYRKLLDKKKFGKKIIECEIQPYNEVNIVELIDGIFARGNPLTKKIHKTSTITLFLASSLEMKNEREKFEIFINRENKRLNKKSIFLQLEVWEDFLDTVSQTRLQDEYNNAIKSSDIFMLLFFTKVGKYTAEEFENAFKHFKETDKPKILTYFKKGDIKTTDLNEDNTASLFAFKRKLKELGHFYTEFENDAELHLHFKKQLEKLFDI